MGVTAAAHMPHVTSSSYPSLQAHLQASHQALRVSSWSLSIRLLRSTLDDDKSRRGQQSQPVNGEAGQGNRSGIDQSSVARRTKFMYQVIISDYPDDVFVLVEDPERPTRATMRIEAAQRRSNNGAKNSLQEVQGENKGEGDDANPQNGIESDARDEAEPNVDAGKETGLETQPKEEEEKPEEENKAAGDELLASDTAQKDVTEVITIDEPDVEMIDSTASKERAVAAEEGKEVRAEEEASEEVKAAPRERNDVPPTTRFSLFAAASSFPALLTSLNLPPALGAPSLGDGASSSQSAAGPGAWLPRGAPLVIEGATWELPSMEGSFASEDRGEWKIRLGLVMHGGTRSGGALVEAEYLPLNTLPPTSPLLTSQLRSLFPAYLLAPNASSGVIPADTLSSMQPSADLWGEVIEQPQMYTNGDEAKEDLLSLGNRQRDPGWVGTERGKRLAFMYINLLRAQGII